MPEVIIHIQSSCLCCRFGARPIHLATSNGHTPMIQVLVDNGASVNAQESWGQTPLMIATQRSRLECMQLLLDYGADKEVSIEWVREKNV